MKYLTAYFSMKSTSLSTYKKRRLKEEKLEDEIKKKLSRKFKRVKQTNAGRQTRNLKSTSTLS